MTSDPPLVPNCPRCKQPMRHVQTLPRIGGLHEMSVFHCVPCNHAETQEDAAGVLFSTQKQTTIAGSGDCPRGSSMPIVRTVLIALAAVALRTAPPYSRGQGSKAGKPPDQQHVEQN